MQTHNHRTSHLFKGKIRVLYTSNPNLINLVMFIYDLFRTQTHLGILFHCHLPKFLLLHHINSILLLLNKSLISSCYRHNSINYSKVNAFHTTRVYKILTHHESHLKIYLQNFSFVYNINRGLSNRYLVQFDRSDDNLTRPRN